MYGSMAMDGAVRECQRARHIDAGTVELRRCAGNLDASHAHGHAGRDVNDPRDCQRRLQDDTPRLGGLDGQIPLQAEECATIGVAHLAKESVRARSEHDPVDCAIIQGSCQTGHVTNVCNRQQRRWR